MKIPFLVLAALALMIAPNFAAETWVYFGTYTGGKSDSQGIYVSRFDLETGVLSEPKLAAEVSSPSFVAVHPNRKNLYAVSERPASGGGKEGTVTAYALDPETGALTKLNARSTGGAAPCHVSVAPSGDAIVVANYTGGSCASLGLAADGSLTEAGSFHQHEGSSVNPKRQKGPHAHSANFSPDGRFAFVTDLGTDEIRSYAFDSATAEMRPHGAVKLTPGSGPRHFAFHPGGDHAWVIKELALTLTGFRYDAESGTLTEIQTISTVPEADRERPGLSTAEVQVHPNGKFVYGSNRGHDTIAAFRINQATGQLAFIEVEPIQGKTPRNFGIAPGGRWLLAAGQGSDSVRVFAIDPESGELTDTGTQVSVASPVCVRFLSLP